MMIIACKKFKIKLLINVTTIVLQKTYNAELNKIKYGFPSTCFKYRTLNIFILAVLILSLIYFFESL